MNNLPETYEQALQLLLEMAKEKEEDLIKTEIQLMVIQDQEKEIEELKAKLLEKEQNERKLKVEKINLIESKEYKLTELENDLWKANNTIEALRYKLSKAQVKHHDTTRNNKVSNFVDSFFK